MFLQTAKLGKNNWWLYLLTLLLVGIGTVAGQLPMLVVLMIKVKQQGLSDEVFNEMASSLDFSAVGINQNWSLLLLLLAFVFGLVGLWFGVKFLHQKTFRHLITPQPTINWRKILFGFGLWFGITAVAELVFYLLSPGNYTMQFDLGMFVGLLAISLLVLPFQTSFEEVIFRGYLLQGISLLTPARWFPLAFTSITFGAMHFMNPEVAAFGVGTTMAYYIGTGLFLGIITLMDDSLELALGVHAATNIFGAVFVTFDESALQTAALFHTSSINMVNLLVAFLVGAGIFLFVAAKKYGWSDWSKCWRAEQTPQNPVA